mmetsp:Transcript_37995/g.119255  ORF Transcript_37995/g.119255 Transcript_37995/m.119255 type:complete len:201 (-) Transcript_37995:590-1192(-)
MLASSCTMWPPTPSSSSPSCSITACVPTWRPRTSRREKSARSTRSWPSAMTSCAKASRRFHESTPLRSPNSTRTISMTTSESVTVEPDPATWSWSSTSRTKTSLLFESERLLMRGRDSGSRKSRMRNPGESVSLSRIAKVLVCESARCRCTGCRVSGVAARPPSFPEEALVPSGLARPAGGGGGASSPPPPASSARAASA